MDMVELTERIDGLLLDLIHAEDHRGYEVQAAAIRSEIHDLKRERDLLPPLVP